MMKRIVLFGCWLSVTVYVSNAPVIGLLAQEKLKNYDQGDSPEVITRSPQAVQDAWERIATDLSKVDTPDQIGEALIRRGHLLLSVHARPRAYEDFRRAASVYIDLQASDETIQHCTLTFLRLLKEGRSWYRPTPDHRVGNLNEYYGAGYHSFWRGANDEALEYFELALDLAPYDPTCHYYRALCYRCRGDEAMAEMAVRTAAFWEYQALRASYGHAPSRVPSRVSQALERVQGNTRLWIEEHRPTRPRVVLKSPEDFVQAFGGTLKLE